MFFVRVKLDKCYFLGQNDQARFFFFVLIVLDLSGKGEVAFSFFLFLFFRKGNFANEQNQLKWNIGLSPDSKHQRQPLLITYYLLKGT